VLLRRKLMDIAIAFARMRPLVAGIRHITANADVTAARIGSVADAFGVVVREFDSVGAALLELITEVEGDLDEMTLVVATWLRGEQRIRTLEITIDVVGSGGDGPSRSLNDSVLDPGAAELWEERREAALESLCGESGEQRAPAGTCGLIERAWDAAQAERRGILESLALIERRCNHLASQLDRVSLVAGRQASFVGVNARIEASRAGIADLAPIVERITRVATEVQEVDLEAQRRIHEVTVLAQEVLAPLRREIIALGQADAETT